MRGVPFYRQIFLPYRRSKVQTVIIITGILRRLDYDPEDIGAAAGGPAATAQAG